MEAEGVCDFARGHMIGLEFACSDGKAVAVKWVPTLTQRSKAEIPESVVANGRGYQVEILTQGLFAKSMVRSVVIPKTVKFLPDKCFEFCENLCELVFDGESQVNYLGKCCFKKCGLAEFDLPDSCVSINEKCFDGCAKLCRIRISERSELEKIGSFAFRGCNVSNLYLPSKLDVSSCGCIFLGVKSFVLGKNIDLVVSDGFILSKDKKHLLHCFSSNPVVEVPDSIKSISCCCFAGSNVRNVIFGEKSKICDVTGAFTGSSIESLVFKQRNSKFFVESGAVHKRTGFPRSGEQNDMLVLQISRQSELLIPLSVCEVGEHCCLHPESLNSVKFDPSCRDVKILNGAFRDSQLTEALLSGVTTVSSKCFFNCKFLKSVSFSDLKISKFKTKAFSMCGLESLCVPRSVTKIGYKCFCGCALLKKLDFEEGSCLKSIGEKAFMNTGLKQLAVPSGVENVKGTSFYGVKELVLAEEGRLTIHNGLLILQSTRSLVSVINFTGDYIIIPSDIRILGRESFYRCGHVHSVSFESDSELSAIEDDAFQYCEVDELYLPRRLSSIGMNVTEKVKQIFVCEGSEVINECGGSYLTRVMKSSLILMNTQRTKDVNIIPDYIDTISRSCFSRRRTGGFALSFSSSELCELRDFQDKAFEGSDIVSISIPASTKNIGRSCFHNCQSLVSISFAPGCSVTSLGEQCFMFSSIAKITIPRSVEELPTNCFRTCICLESVAFEEGSCLQWIGSNAFRGTGLSEITLPKSLQRIDDEAFRGTSLLCLTLPASIEKLGNKIFANCTQLESVGFSDGAVITKIEGQNIFKGTNIRAITIPDNVVKFNASFLPDGCRVWISPQNKSLVCDDRFVYSSDRKKLVRCFKSEPVVLIPHFIERIGGGCFSGCKSVRDMRFEEGSGLKKIGGYAFKGLNLSKLILPKSFKALGYPSFAFKGLGYNMFAMCEIGTLKFEADSELREIRCSIGKVDHLVIPGNVESIAARSIQKARRISVDPMNAHFSADDHFLFNKDQTRLIFMFDMNVVDVVIPKQVEVLCSHCFSKRKQVKSINFESGSELHAIESYALQDTSISRFVVPQSVEEIDVEAFSGCSQLKEIIYDDCVLTHLNCAMFEDTHLRYLSGVCDFERVRVKGLEYVCSNGKSVAVKWSPLAQKSKVEIPETVVANGRKYQVELLTQGLFAKSVMRIVVIPNTVKFLPDKCFEFCENLCEFVFDGASRVNYLGKCCFKKCGLTEFDLPDSCVIIGEKCFDGCAKLCQIRISEKSELEKIGCFAFRGCNICNLFLPSGLDLLQCDSAFVGVKNIVSDQKSSIIVRDESVISSNEKVLLHCFSSKATFHVPETIVRIQRWAFAESNVRTVVFGERSKIESMSGAFAGSSIENVVFEQRDCEFVVNNGILFQQMGLDKAVLYCTPHNGQVYLDISGSKITCDSIGNPKSLHVFSIDPKCERVRIGARAFKGSSVSNVELNGVRTVSSKCFWNCRFLKVVHLPRVCVFENKAFGLSGLEKLSVPKSVREIGRKCFYGCTLLKELTFEKGSLLESIGE